jgi:hypothetical protein
MSEGRSEKERAVCVLGLVSSCRSQQKARSHECLGTRMGTAQRKGKGVRRPGTLGRPREAQHDGSTASAGGVQQSAEQSGAGWSRSEEIDSSDKRYKSAQSGTSDTERGSGRRRQRRTPNAEADGYGNMVGAEAAPTMRVTPRIDGGPAAGRTGTAGDGDTRRS